MVAYGMFQALHTRVNFYLRDFNGYYFSVICAFSRQSILRRVQSAGAGAEGDGFKHLQTIGNDAAANDNLTGRVIKCSIGCEKGQKNFFKRFHTGGSLSFLVFASKSLYYMILLTVEHLA
jgi:hypothetical protein